MTKLLGVDISEHNGNVDFARMKADGVKFAMLRTSWGHFAKDNMIDTNVAKCKSAGLPYGFYHYSYASTDAEATQEAKSFLTLCKQLGGYTYPLNLDMEDADGWKARNGVGDDQNLRTIKIFKDILEDDGQYMTLYMSKSWFDRLRAKNKALINSIDPWLAHWGITEPSMDCGMWQYSSDGVVNGSSARTDVNWCYKDYPSILANVGVQVSPAPTPAPKPTPKPDTSIGIKAGDKVKIKSSATHYVTGEEIPGWVKGNIYTVYQTGNGKVLLKEIMSWVRIADIQGQKDVATGLFTGKKVKVKTSAKTYATGEEIPGWVKGQTYTIYQTGNGKVLLKEIMSWVRNSDVQ